MAHTDAKVAGLLGPLSTRSAAERWLTRLAAALVSAGAYLLFIPWDTRNRATAAHPYDETTPVTGLGVVLLGVALVLLAAYIGHRDHVAWALLLVAVPPSILMFVSFSSHPEQDVSLWPLAWAFFTAIMAGAALVAALVGGGLRTRTEA
ncbi:hypothetical protein [Streptomyces beijiangensis]|uniref:Uncharacterized protein n=1 Tax=Streptomyces beijiangensis TaxID=163361 RepID=A0A939FBP8_9ACTN|nr:hypothetical protein [Streptomyces beijiangensis]MBO0516321.1 hypothetical protein [Streptomyces beijiangensis]